MKTLLQTKSDLLNPIGTRNRLVISYEISVYQLKITTFAHRKPLVIAFGNFDLHNSNTNVPLLGERPCTRKPSVEEEPRSKERPLIQKDCL